MDSAETKPVCRLCGKKLGGGNSSMTCWRCRRNHSCPVCKMMHMEQHANGWCAACEAALQNASKIRQSLGYQRPSPQDLAELLPLYAERARLKLPLFGVVSLPSSPRPDAV